MDASTPTASASARVCLDGRSLSLPEGTGVATYARTLAASLSAAGRNPGLLLDVPSGEDRGAGRARRWIRAAWPGALRAEALERHPGRAGAWLASDVFRTAQVHFDIYGRLLAVRSRRPPALMHWSYPLPLTFKGAPNLYTVHDLIPLRHPALTPIDKPRFARLIAQVARRADHIVTVSEASRRDLIALLGLPKARVTNTYQPVDLLPDPHAAPPPRRGHFLFCGTVEPRKNLRRLIAAHRASGAAAPLVLVGPDGWRAAEELAAGGAEVRPLAALRAGERGGVWRAPWLPRPALVDLLRGARALLFPSLAEGFGLPIAEAMTLGVPVLTAAGGATEEVAGDAALLVDPRDVAAMASAIGALDRDGALRSRLAAAGLRRASLFSAEACLRSLEAVYSGLEGRHA